MVFDLSKMQKWKAELTKMVYLCAFTLPSSSHMIAIPLAVKPTSHNLLIASPIYHATRPFASRTEQTSNTSETN